MSPGKKRLVFVLLAVLLAVAAIEGALRLLVVAVAVSDEPMIPDARLGHRPNPAYPGHDRQGFRNPSVPSSADVVALGDSQTYGTGVAAEAAWPKRLEQIEPKRSVYSMAYGGYGPAHSLLLWDQAMALKPKVVVEAFYAGNDLYDAYALVHNRGQLPELKSSDAGLLERIRAAEAKEPIDAIVTRLYNMGTTPVPAAKKPAAPPPPADWRSFLTTHSMIFSVLATAKQQATRQVGSPQGNREADWKAAKAWAAARAQFCEPFEDGDLKTIFTSEYRLTALNLDDPRIEEGLHISLRAIRAMSERAKAANTRFVVLMIPSKETVFQARAKNINAHYTRLVANEAKLWTAVKDFLAKNNIPAVDSLPALQELLATGVQPYQVTHDGHPNEAGQQAIAAQVAAQLAR